MDGARPYPRGVPRTAPDTPGPDLPPAPGGTRPAGTRPAGTRPGGTRPGSTADTARLIRWEIALVLAVTFGTSALRAALKLADRMLSGPLGEQVVALNTGAARSEPIDLALQLLWAAQLCAWGGLAVFLLVRSGRRFRDIGLDRERPGGDALRAVGLAAAIGLPGLVLYVVAVRLGVNLQVQPSALRDVWWADVSLLVTSFANGFAEEVVVVAYVVTRIRDLGGRPGTAIAASALLRAGYHLYQGFGAGLGNLVMGVVFAGVWHRTGRLWPLILAHFLMDAVAFLGYPLVADLIAGLTGRG